MFGVYELLSSTAAPEMWVHIPDSETFEAGYVYACM